jgi:hypothetical protein
MVNGLRFINMEYGVRFTVHGFCFMGHGSWFMKFMDTDLWLIFYVKVMLYHY